MAKNILVVGCNGGMGKSICNTLLKNGYNVLGMDYQQDTQLDVASYHCADVRNFEQIQVAYNSIASQVDNLYAVVYAAGIYAMNSLLEIDANQFENIFNINVFGAFRINKLFSSLMQKGSRFVIVSSELAPLQPLPFTGLYGITKSTLEKYAYSLRMEVNLLGMSVSIIRPGAVKTKLLDDTETQIDDFCKNTKLYSYNAKRFKKIIDSVESKYILPDKLAKVVLRSINSKKPKFVYNINRNFLLKLLHILPHRFQVWVIKQILITK